MRTESTPSPTEEMAPKRAKSSAGASKGTRQAAPYKHGKGYALRKQHDGHDLFVSGYKTGPAAQKAMNRKVAAIDGNKLPVGAGPKKTSLAQALQDYALQRLPFLKGAEQEARRINNYLRAAGLRLLKVTKAKGPTEDNPKTGGGCYFDVELVKHTDERVIPNGLGGHRRKLLNATAGTEKIRAVLAGTAMQDVTRQLMQEYVDAMRQDRRSASTIALERAFLRSLFNYAFTTWHWVEVQDNPATKLKMPKVDNARKRVLSFDEQTLLEQALAECRNERVEPALTLLRETAMRASEPLEVATWADVDWERCVLSLNDGKAGAREVPLSPAAMGALETLAALSEGRPEERIVGISYESLRAAWKRACSRVGIKDLRIHDLRHTAATRMALATGNVFLVKALTGHKTLKMLERYVNVSADDVVKAMRAPVTPASQVFSAEASDVVEEGGVGAESTEAVVVAPSNVIPFPVRRAA